MKKILFKLIIFFFGKFGDFIIKKIKIFFSLNWLRDKLFNKTFEIKKDSNFYFKVYDVGQSSSIRARKFFRSEPDTIEFIDSFDKNSTFIDCGANIGLYSLYAASQGHKVFSFEPESANFYLLNKNILLNKFTNKIKAYPIALNKNFSFNELYLSKFEWGGSCHTFGRKLDYNLEKFEPEFTQGSISMSLDFLYQQSKINIDYMKIDVDGNELYVVEGMINLIKEKKIKKILIELNLNLKEHIEVKKIFNENGYFLLNQSKNKVNENLIFSK
jgi:FkbM family methyltransferase